MHTVLAHGWLVGVIAFGVLSLACLDGDLRVHHDAGVYVSLASALASGQGYADIYLQGAPAHTKYPPLFPMLLAPIVAALGRHIVAMKLVVVASALASLGALYVFCRRQDSRVLASLVVMLTATSHGFLYYTQTVMSEMPYVLLSLLALLGLQRLSRTDDWPPRLVAAVVLGLIAVYLTRLLGLSLLIAATAWTILDTPAPLSLRLKRATVLGGLGAVPALAWGIRNMRLGEIAGTSYNWGASAALSADSFRGGLIVVVERVGVNLVKYARHLTQIVFFPAPSLSGVLLPVAVSLAVAGGFVGCLLFRRTVLEYYVVLYASAIVLFPGSRPQRYLVPMIPFVWYYGLVALRAIHRAVAPRVGRPSLAAATAALVAVLLVANLTTAVRANWLERGRDGYYHVTGEDDYERAAHWARAHSPPDSVFLWAKPALRYLLSDRRALRPPSRKATASTADTPAGPLDYIVVDDFAETGDLYLRHALRRHGVVCPVYRDHVSTIYAVGHRCPSEAERAREPLPLVSR